MNAGRPDSRPARLVLAVLVVTGLTGCAVPIGAPPGATTPLRPMTVLEARQTLRSTPVMFSGGRERGAPYASSRHLPHGGGELMSVTVRAAGLTFIVSADPGRREGPPPANSVRCEFGKITPRAERDGDRDLFRIDFGEACGVETHFFHPGRDQAAVERVVDALIVLRQHARGAIASGESEAEFAEAVRYYRGQRTKPTLPESARRFAVHAAAAARNKEYGEAIDLYAQALAIAPWWPEGYFNRALLLAEDEAYAEAISEMKRYVALAPDAPDARAAQDKIYEWERPPQQRRVTLAATPPSPSPQSRSDDCFIATAAYGSSAEWHVATLRDFRDGYLAGNAVGRGVIALYSWVSPPVADRIRHHELARAAVRATLAPVVYAVGYPEFAGGGLAVVLLLVSVRCWRRGGSS